MSATDPLVELVTRAAAAFEHGGFAYAVVGALARNAWARPRATTDADFGIAVAPHQLPALHELIDDLGLRIRKQRPGDGEVPELLLLCGRVDSSLRLDLLVASTPFEDSVLSRRRRVRMAGADVWVASPEDLLVYKLVAGRPRDLVDVEDVATTQKLAGATLDWDYVNYWTEAFGVADRARTLREKITD